ncbi:unnamed protein product, partial [Pleuronectes platessa]
MQIVLIVSEPDWSLPPPLCRWEDFGNVLISECLLSQQGHPGPILQLHFKNEGRKKTQVGGSLFVRWEPVRDVIMKEGRMLRLRCKTKNGSHLMQGLTHQSCVQELKRKVEELTGIPCDVQKIMVGYPPSSLDLRNGDAHLKDYPIKSGDTLIVEEEKNKPKPQDHPTVTKVPRLEASPVLARRVVPADNSCLFTSVYYVVEGGVYDAVCAPEMRSLIAQIVSSDPAAYWCSILSKFYQCEICVVDTQTVRVDRFGEDAGYQKRVLLIYDGINYDPLQKETPGSDVPPQTIFSTTDDVILALALELADEARRKRQFTDVNRFALRCMVCQTGLVGQKEAREHAKETGHTNFGE